MHDIYLLKQKLHVCDSSFGNSYTAWKVNDCSLYMHLDVGMGMFMQVHTCVNVGAHAKNQQAAWQQMHPPVHGPTGSAAGLCTTRDGWWGGDTSLSEDSRSVFALWVCQLKLPQSGCLAKQPVYDPGCGKVLYRGVMRETEELFILTFKKVGVVVSVYVCVHACTNLCTGPTSKGYWNGG